MKVAVRAAFVLIILLEILGPFAFPNAASDFTWLGLIVTAIFAWGIMEYFRLSALILWITFVATVLDAASALFELYSRIEPWDLWIHALGGAIIAMGALEIVLRALKKDHITVRQQTPFVIGAVYLFTTTVGFLYEFWEYLVDKLQYGYPKSLVSAYDSVEDQLFNLLGATLVLAVYFFCLAKLKRRASR